MKSLHCFEEKDGRFVRCAIMDMSKMTPYEIWDFYHLQNSMGRVVIEEESQNEST